MNMPSPESLMSLGGPVCEITREINASDIAVPARSFEDMRPGCKCCKEKKSRVKSIRNIMIREEIETHNRFNILQDGDTFTEDRDTFTAEIMCITKDHDQIAQVQEDDQW